MPFKSSAQRAYMFLHHPEIAKRWAKEFPNQKKLPKHVKKKSKLAKRRKTTKKKK